MPVAPSLSATGTSTSSTLMSHPEKQWHPLEWLKSVAVSEWLILCHCKQLNFTLRLEIGKSEKCHCNQMALYCVTVTSVTVSDFSCIMIQFHEMSAAVSVNLPTPSNKRFRGRDGECKGKVIGPSALSHFSRQMNRAAEKKRGRGNKLEQVCLQGTCAAGAGDHL